MSIDEMANAIYELAKRGGVSFVEVEDLFGSKGFDYKGDLALSAGCKNIHFWYGWNQNAIDAMMKAQELGVRLVNDSVLVYYFDGKAWDVPIANVKKIKAGYKDEHWLPAVLCV